MDNELEILKTKLANRERQLNVIYRMSAALHQHSSVSAILSEALEVSLDVLGAEAGTVFLHDSESQTLKFAHLAGKNSDSLDGMAIPDHAGIAGKVFKTGVPEVTENVANIAEHYTGIDQQVSFTSRDMVCVPLKAIDGHPIGVVQLLNKKEGSWEEADLEMLTVMATLCATAIENARFFQTKKIAEMVHLMGNISHDLKNMVVPTVMGLDMMHYYFGRMMAALDKAKAATPADHDLVWDKVGEAMSEFENFMPIAIKSAKTSSQRLMDRVLNIAEALKGNTTEAYFEPTDVKDLLAEVGNALGSLVQKEAISLSINVPEQLPPVPLDRKQMFSALYNLTDNAVVETPEGGMIQLKAKISGSNLVINVIDTGKGIPEHVKQRLFTPNAISTKPGGTGLGTLIAKNAVVLHNGKIDVQSKIGEGTTFTIQIPLVQN